MPSMNPEGVALRVLTVIPHLAQTLQDVSRASETDTHSIGKKNSSQPRRIILKEGKQLKAS